MAKEQSVDTLRDRHLPSYRTRMIGDKQMSSGAQKRVIERVMHACKKSDLKSSSGREVKSRRQTVAIAMSESGQSKKRKDAS